MTCDGIDNGGDTCVIVTKRYKVFREVEGWKVNFFSFMFVIIVIVFLTFAIVVGLAVVIMRSISGC